MTSENKKPVLVRITTLPVSMKVLLKGQPGFMQQNGFDVKLISSDGIEIESLKAQEKCEHFIVPLTRKINPLIDLVSMVKLFFLLKKIKPDIVHTHTPKAGLIGMWAAKLAGVPIRLHTIAGLPWMEYSGFMKKLLIAVEKLTASAAHAVYPNSKIQHQFLKANNIATNKMKVLGNGSSNGIDLTYFSKDASIQAVAKRLRVDEKVLDAAVIWIFAGRLVTHKGISELLFAFEKINKQFPDDRLWLLGEEEPLLDPLTPEQQKIIHQHPSIRSFGFVKDLRSHFAAANVLVFPSYREGFPNVPMQAGAMGCCLILSDINGCNEIVQHEKNGLLFRVKNENDLFEAMLRIRKNEVERKHFATAIQERVQDFSQQKLWNFILDEYTMWLTKKNRI